jgi:hypothetical protein
VSSAIRRICLLACVALSILGAGASLASAAGKPTSVEVKNTHELGGYTVLELTAKVNPNGASTSTVIEYREDGAGEATPWTKAVVHNFNGTTLRSYAEELQIDPVKNYEVRVTATNVYGATVSSVGHGVSTRVRTTSEKELTNVPFGSSGTASFAFTFIGFSFQVICSESMSGRIGNPGGTKDIYKYEISHCITYIDGKHTGACEVSNFTFTLSGPTLAVQNPGFIPLPVAEESCTFGSKYWQIYPEAFRVVDNGSTAEYGKTRSVSLTANAHMGASNPASVTFESNWFLTAEYVGVPFKITSVGL